MGPLDRRLLRRAGAVRTILAVDAGAGVVATIVLLAQMTILATVIAAVVDGDAEARPALGVALAVLVVLVLTRAGLAHLVERAGRRAATRVMSTLRSELVARRLHGGGADLDDLDGATMATAAVQGVDGLEVYFARYLPQLVLAVVVPAAVLVWTAVIDLESALIMLVTLPLIPVFMWLIGRATAARAEAGMSALVALSVHFLDLVRGLPTLRAFNRGRAQLPKIEASAEAYRRTTMATLRISFLSGFVLDLATTLSIALVAVTLGVRLVGGTLALRPALVVLLLVPELYAPIRAVGTLFHASADGLAGARRILDVLDRPTPAEALPATLGATSGSTPARAGTEPIELHGVTVSFPGRPVPALDGVDLRVEPGEVLAVAGPSGAGKTTLGRVLLGLVPADAGAVVVGGVPRRAADLDAWRAGVGWAAQRPVLVHDTVAANIALGRADLARQVVVGAARRAGADEFVDRMVDGYETVIGDGGRGLSAGQRQRIGLARALVRDPTLLVLDEPTAHLDAGAAAAVAATVAEMRGRATVVVLTHDPTLVDIADRVVHLDRGRLRAAADPGDGAPVALGGQP